MPKADKSKYWKHCYVVNRGKECVQLESPARQAPNEIVAVYRFVELRLGKDIFSDMDQMGMNTVARALKR